MPGLLLGAGAWETAVRICCDEQEEGVVLDPSCFAVIDSKNRHDGLINRSNGDREGMKKRRQARSDPEV